MKIFLKQIFTAVLTALLLCTLAIPCLGAEQTGRITVNLKDPDKNGIDGMAVHICQVATLTGVGYYPVPAFENSGISISAILNNPDEAVAKTIADYVKSNRIPSASARSVNGRVSFQGLDLGIWLVFPQEAERYTFNPYVVLLPFTSGGALQYEVSSDPKLEDHTPDRINVYVIKRWEDQNNKAKKRPDSVTIRLLDGDKTVSSAVLSEENGWAHTFSDLPKDGDYTVSENAVADYKADYGGDALNGFVVTNTVNVEKLPQTGQYWWPVALLAVAGICFVLLGIYEIGVKKNEKEK